MSEDPVVSIVTVNYGQAAVTNQLLASLSAVRNPSFEVIVVDNYSGKEDYKNIDCSYPFVTLLTSSENLGFAGGNNMGIRKARGRYILLLNNDTEVEPGFLSPMVSLLESDSSVGAVSPKIRYFHQPEIIQYAGFSPMNPFTSRMHALGFGEIDRGQHERIRATSFAHGCAMMVPARVIREVGLMRESYFLYYEEHDWSTRIRSAGYRIMYQPASLVLHKESVSVQRASPMKVYYINRNRILYIRFNLHGIEKIVALLYLILVSVPVNTLRFTIKREWKFLKAYLRSLGWNLSHPQVNKIVDKPYPSY